MELPLGRVSAIRGALDTFDAPVEARIEARIAGLDPEVVVDRVMAALLSPGADFRAVFAELAASAARSAVGGSS